ncbi:type I restriction enzyme HsdR N-terminal domain-containing protein [Bacteroidota bacterium]
MARLNLPEYHFEIKIIEGKKCIFDSIRKKFMVLTPEEWVRQHFIQYLVHEKKYPPGLISIESSLKLFKLSKRTDILVHNQKGEPLLLVECKAPEIKLNQKVFDQLFSYNLKYGLKNLIVTNGMVHYYCYFLEGVKEPVFESKIPSFNELNEMD